MPTDWEDHQPRPIPHSSLLDSQSGATVPASPSTLDVSNLTLAGYRAVRVSVAAGAHDIDVTVSWQFADSAGGVTPSETQTVSAGATTSLLFRAQGHIATQVSFASVGGSSTIDYDIAGSNLDPLPPSAAGAVSDSFAPQQFANIFGYDRAGSDWVGFGAPTIDAACVYNGYVASSGTQNDFLDMRFSLGPKSSLWWFEFMYLTGPNYGEMWGYLGTPHEDGIGSGEPDPTNLLTPIDASAGDFVYRLAFKVTCWSAAVTRNVTAFVGAQKTGLNPYAAGQLRIGGDGGDTLTMFTLPAGSNFVTGDGGPGVYALKIVAGSKVGISTGYKLALQSVCAHRVDQTWA